MNSWNDVRAREESYLQLALATFALQLEVFERQTDEVLRSIGCARDYRTNNDGHGHEFGEGGKIARQ